MEKTERLEQAIQRRNVPEITAERLTAATVTTPTLPSEPFVSATASATYSISQCSIC